MARNLKQVTCTMAALAPDALTPWFRHITAQPALFPFYHLVSDEPVVHIRHLYRVRTVAEFRRDVAWLLKHFRPADPRRVLQDVRECGFNRQEGFLLTFDDGLREFHDVVAPVLLEMGLPAVCFLNSGFIGNRDLFFRYKASILYEWLTTHPVSNALADAIHLAFRQRQMPFNPSFQTLFTVGYGDREFLDELAALLGIEFGTYLRENRPYLDASQINSLIGKGFMFGAHSIDHPMLADLPQEQQLVQVWESLSAIRSEFHLDYGLFSFPFTDHGLSAGFFRQLFSGGREAVDITFGAAGIKTDSVGRNIQRIPMETGRFSGRDVVVGEYLAYLIKKSVDRHRIVRM